MVQTILFTVLGGIVGTVGSIVLIPFFRSLSSEIQLATAAFLGAVCSSILVCREKSIQRRLGKEPKADKKGLLAKLKTVLFWLVLISGLAGVTFLVLKVSGQI